jgi:hypothetical protein
MKTINKKSEHNQPEPSSDKDTALLVALVSGLLNLVAAVVAALLVRH